jgi:hypothetical protein
MSRRPTQKEKTQQAFQAYLDLLDTAEWFRAQMRAPLESFDLTMEGFRLLTILYGEGALPITQVARRRGCSLQNTHRVVARLQARRWVGRMIVNLPPAEIAESRLPVAERGKQRKAFEDGEGVDEGDQRAPAKSSERDLPATASGRCREIREGDPDAGGGGRLRQSRVEG